MAGLLEVKELCVSYGAIRALDKVSLSIPAGEIVSVIGANGAGKSTLMSAVMGQVPYHSGEIEFEGKPLPRRSFQVVKSGISLSPEGRRIFAPLTVLENLKIATFARKDHDQIARDYERVFALFPRLADRKRQRSESLSGGEQQMLAVGRAFMSGVDVILLDEPSMGLSPLLMKELFKVLKQLNESGVTIVVVEQNAHLALKYAHRAYVLENGQIVMEGQAQELAKDPRVEKAYLG